MALCIRKTIHYRMVASLLLMAFAMPASVLADDRNPAYRLGAFSGAMKYCEERYDEKSVRYGLARLRVAKEVDNFSGKEKLVALTGRDRAYNRGQFLGNRLNRNECRALLRMGEWKRFFAD
ncbi:hypothetical protein [Thauera butanivorans]|uniref:hypothetical protein n=1 Tax=Thauera butanivorans TaxID=86174 RepID=UPI00083901F5|nr:hypothetical protein [Thauera butanivorans]